MILNGLGVAVWQLANSGMKNRVNPKRDIIKCLSFNITAKKSSFASQSNIFSMKPLFDFLRRFGKVPPQDAAVIEKYAKIGNLLPGEHFLMPGKVCNKVGFLLNGVFRVYAINENGKEVIRGFPAENHFMIDLKSFSYQQVSIEYWEALTKVKYLFWTVDDVFRMKKEITCWQDILILMSYHILLSELHEKIEMLSDNAESRYLKFCARHPHIVSRVPLKFVANYLGIAPQTLSRIRQQLAKRSISSQILITK